MWREIGEYGWLRSHSISVDGGCWWASRVEVYWYFGFCARAQPRRRLEMSSWVRSAGVGRRTIRNPSPFVVLIGTQFAYGPVFGRHLRGVVVEEIVRRGLGTGLGIRGWPETGWGVRRDRRQRRRES